MHRVVRDLPSSLLNSACTLLHKAPGTTLDGGVLTEELKGKLSPGVWRGVGGILPKRKKREDCQMPGWLRREEGGIWGPYAPGHMTGI